MSSVAITLLLLILLPLPYSVDSNPPLRTCPVTLLLALANVGIFAATHVSAHGLIDPIGAYSQFGLTPSSVTAIQLASYMFMHVSVAHVLWNMFFLLVFGPSVESRLGSLAFAAVYLFGGVAAGLLDSALVMHIAPNSSSAYEPLVGASGAISAVLGVFVVFGFRRSLNLLWPLGAVFGRGWLLLEIPAGIGIGIWVAQSLWGAVSSIMNAGDSGVAYFAHIGGFAFGAVCAAIGGLHSDSNMPRRPGPSDHGDNGVRAGSTVAARVGANAGLPQLLERAIEAGDYERAESLLAKCRAVRSDVRQSVLEQLGRLAAESGLPERAAELKEIARQSLQ